jgi:hypothetical protein
MGKPGMEGDHGKHGEKVPYDCNAMIFSHIPNTIITLVYCMYKNLWLKLDNWTL